MTITIYTELDELPNTCRWRLARHVSGHAVTLAWCGKAPSTLLTLLQPDGEDGVYTVFSGLCWEHREALPANICSQIVTETVWVTDADFVLSHDGHNLIIQCSRCCDDGADNSGDRVLTVKGIREFSDKHLALHDPKKVVVH